MKNSTEKNKVYDPMNPNAILDLESFDYHNPQGFKGEEFKQYNELLDSICNEFGTGEHPGKNFLFELHRAAPIRVERYPGMPNTPVDFVGVMIKTDQQKNSSVVHKTNITIQQARIHNQQIHNAHSLAGYGTYYLLKKN